RAPGWVRDLQVSSRPRAPAGLRAGLQGVVRYARDEQPLLHSLDQIVVARGRRDLGSSRDVAPDVVDAQHRAERSTRELVGFRGEPGYHDGAGGRQAPIAGDVPGSAEFF